VLPQLLHQMSCVADPVFKEHLTDCLSRLFADGGLEGECYLLAEGSVKSVNRMEVKVLEYRDEAEYTSAALCTSLVSDPLRPTVVCTTSHVMVKALQAVTTAIPSLTRVLRIKNKLAELKKPLNLHLNLVFQPPNTTPVTVEIQFMHEAGPAKDIPNDLQHISNPRDLSPIPSARWFDNILPGPGRRTSTLSPKSRTICTP
jgi:hypothetical protein